MPGAGGGSSEWGGMVETTLTPEYQKVLLGEQSEQEMCDHIAAKLTEVQKKWLKSLPTAD